MLLTLRESTTTTKPKIDKVKGIIHDVKVLNETSRNNFVYPKETRVRAHKLLENLRVNINHKKKKDEREDTPLQSRFGRLQNVRETETGTIADLKYNIRHSMADEIIYAAEELSDTLGLSINGDGRGTRRDTQGRKIVDDIIRLKSVDLVADPGSTLSLFESENPVEPELNPEMEGAKAHISTLMNNAKTVEELKKALAEYAKGEEEEEEEEETVSESDKTLARLQTEKACLVLCESMKYPVTADVIDLLSDLPDEAKRKALITKLKTTSKTAPRSSALPLRESETPEEKNKKLLTILRG